MNAIQPKRVKHSYIQSLCAAPEKVFPLLCPTLEKEWVPNWDPELIVSKSGVAEKDCIFVTLSELHNSIWIITRYDAKSHTLEMYKITPEHTVGKLEISLMNDGNGGTKAKVAYEYTALGPAGESFLEEFTDEWYKEFMQGWENALNHYLATGKKITE